MRFVAGLNLGVEMPMFGFLPHANLEAADPGAHIATARARCEK